MTYRTSFTATALADREETIVDGRFSSDGTQFLKDSENVNIGTDGDLKIYHSGSHSFIQDEGTGNLYIDSNQLYLRNASDDTVLLQTTSGGQVQINFNGQKKIHTIDGGVTVTGYIQMDGTEATAAAGNIYVEDNGKLVFGGGSDVQIYHENSGNNGMIFNKTGDLYIQGNNGSGAAQTAIQIHSNEGVDLKFAGLGPKLSTLTNGVAITGEAIITQSGATGGGYFNLAVKNTNASNDYSLIYFQSTDTGSSTSSAAAIRSNFAADDSSANGRLEIRTRNSGTLTTALTLNETQNATFAGDVKIHKSGDASLNIRDTSANAVSNWIEVDSSDGLAIYNCYKEGVGTAYPHVFKGYTTEYGRFDAGGIKLPATKGIQVSTYGEDDSNAATTVTGNTLSDYEEGTWTPQFSNGFGAAAQTHGTDGALAVGSYTKVGNLVNVSFILRLADDTGGAHPSTTNGQRINISGLPFTSSSTSYHYGAGSTAYHHFVGTSNATASASILVGTQTTVLDFYQGNTSFVGGDGSDQKSKTLYGMATYHTTS